MSKYSVRERVLDGYIKHLNKEFGQVIALMLIIIAAYYLAQYFFQDNLSTIVLAIVIILEIAMCVQIAALWNERNAVVKDRKILMLKSMLESDSKENIDDYLLAEVADTSESKRYVEYKGTKLYYEKECTAEEMRSALNNAYPELRDTEYVIEGNKVVIIDDLTLLMKEQERLENKEYSKKIKKYKRKKLYNKED